MVDYDPFEDARAPVPMKETEHAKEEHSKATTDSEPSGSTLTPSAVGPDPIGKAREGGWESLDGPVYYNTSVRNEDGNTRYVNHFVNAKPQDPKHRTGSDKNPRPNGPLPMMGIMPEPLHHHQQVNYIDRTKTACADCADCAAQNKCGVTPHHDSVLKRDFKFLTDKVAHLKKELRDGTKTACANPATKNKDGVDTHHDDVFKRDFKSLTDKVAHLEKELGVTILHLVHEGQSWVRKAHPHAKSTGAEGTEHELDLARVGKVPTKNHPSQAKDPGSFWVRMAETSPFF
ncbi:hypothetical protein MMC30_003882 [Trapelia coarctata]|nr:hypothetical protein [Trapelia coarctata]